MGLLNCKVAVITGATSGIGAATASLFASEGALSVLVGRNATRGEEIASQIVEAGNQAVFYACDVSSPEEADGLARYVENQFHKVDVLFNNAGIFLPSMEIEKMPVEDWKLTFQTDIDGVFYVTRALKELIFKCKGCIVNNASIAGMHSYVTGRSYAYSAAKAAVIQFSRQMAKNYACDGVRVNCVCPGIIDTPILGYPNKQEIAKRAPLGYLGEPIDVARAALFLASEYASYITGAVLPVDGGVSL